MTTYLIEADGLLSTIESSCLLRHNLLNSSLALVLPIVFNMHACIDWILPGNSNLFFTKILGWNKNWIPAFEAVAKDTP